MKTVSPTELRANIYRLLEEILETGIPLEVKKGGQRLRIVPVGPVDKFDNLVERAAVISGDAADLPEISWEGELTLDLP